MEWIPVRWSNWGSFDLVVLNFFDERSGVASATFSSAAWLERFLVGWPWLLPPSDFAIAPVALRDKFLEVIDACVGCGVGFCVWGVVLAFFAEVTISLPSLASTMSRFLPLLLTEVVWVCMLWFGPSIVAGGSDGEANAFFTLMGADFLPIQSC